MVTSSRHVKVGQQNVILKWLNVQFTSLITFKNYCRMGCGYMKAGKFYRNVGGKH